MKNLKKAKIHFLLIVILFGLPGYLFAMERLKDGMDLYMRNKYLVAQKKIVSYLKKNPEDSLAIDMLDMAGKAICSIHLKKAFSLLSEELDNEANKELGKAAKHHAGYTKSIEANFSSYLKEYPRAQAANKIILELINNPEPSKTTVYEINRRLRKRMAASSISTADRARLKKLKITVAKLKHKKKWDKAVELITKFMINNPGYIEAKLMLSEINRLAAEDFYNQAVGYFEKAKNEQAKISIQKSRNYDPGWFKSKISSDTAQAKINIAMKKDEQAKKQLNVLKNIDPKNSIYSFYLDLLDVEGEGFFESSLAVYKAGNITEAIARFEFLKLREPDNRKVRLYFHLASARKFIKEVKLDEVKLHLIQALKLFPDEKEALDIFDRLQDVLEIMSEK